MDARVVERSLHEADERVVVLAHVLDFGFRLRDHGYDAISAFSAAEAAVCGVERTGLTVGGRYDRCLPH